MELYAERVANKGLCAQAQAESLKYKLIGGLAVRRACYGVLRFIMESGAKGAEVTVSGKVRAQRAKGMKFSDGYMIKTGRAAEGGCHRAQGKCRAERRPGQERQEKWQIRTCGSRAVPCVIFFLLLTKRICLVLSTTEYVDSAIRHVLMRQGVLGVKVEIMLPHDPKGVMGPKIPLSDKITIMEPKEDGIAMEPQPYMA